MHNKFFGVVAIFLLPWQTDAQTLTRTPLAISPELNVYSSIEWVDLDGDGDFDIVELYSDPSDDALSFVKVYQNTNGVYTREVGAFAVAIDARSYDFNDGDGDGDIDFIFLDNEGVKIGVNNGNFAFGIQSTTISNPNNLRTEVHWQDLDGDLDTDIVFDTFTYMYVAGAYQPALHNMPALTRNRSWADVNNDGYLDMVSTKGQTHGVNPLFLFINQGDGLFKEKQQLSPGFLDGGQAHWLDADADKDLDLFITEEGEKCTLLENTFSESGTSELLRSVSFKSLSNVKADVGDINLDGLPDILLSGQVDPRFETYLYLNTSAADEIVFLESDLEISPYFISNFDLMDMDGDADLDLFILGWEDGDYLVRTQDGYNVNPGNTRPFPEAPGTLATVVGEEVTLSWEHVDAEGAVFFDLSITLDGVPFSPGLARADGGFLMPDALTFRTMSHVTLQNLPPGNYEWRVQAFDHAYRASGFSPSNSFTVMESPTSLTLVALAYNKVEITWQYTGTATGFAVLRRSTNGALEELGTVQGGTMIFTDGDVPPNEHVEYVIKAIADGSYSAPSMSVDYYSAQFDEAPFNPAGPNIIAVSGASADWDQDQDYDLGFIGRIDDLYETSRVLNNSGLGVYSGGVFLPTTEEITTPAVSRDMDNDGDIDVCAIVGSVASGYKVAVYKNNGSGSFTKSFETVAHQAISQVMSEDMNHDGLPDLMIKRTVGNASENPPRYELLYQIAGGSFADSKVNFLSKDDNTSGLGDFYLADLNNDGFTDVIFTGGYTVKAKLFENLKGHAFKEVSFGFTSLTDPSFFDFNGDGTLDIIQRGFQELYLHAGLGSAQFGAPEVISIAGIGANEKIQIAVADLDFNGWQDLVVNDSYNTTLLHNTGEGNFVRADYEFAADWGASVILTDIEADGDLDLVKLGNDNYHQGKNYYYKNRSISSPGQSVGPSAVSSLQVTRAGNGTTLSWAPSTDDTTPSKLISYHVKLVDGNGKFWVHPETNAAGTFRRRLAFGNAGFRTSFTINDLPAGHYTAHVQAVDAAFKLSASSSITFDITAGPTALTIERILLNKVKLAWTDGPLNSTATVVARKSTSSDFQIIAELAANATTFTEDGLEYGDLYTYHVYEKSGITTTSTSNVATWNTNLLILEQSNIVNATGSLDVGDYTGDGKMDMLIFGGRIFNGIETGLTSALLEKTAGGWTQVNAGTLTIANEGTSRFYDINDDHRLDLYQHGFLYTDSKYKTHVLLNNGNKTFSETTNSLTSEDLAILETWDYDRDNDLDYYVMKPGVGTALMKNNGAGAFVKDTDKGSCCDNILISGDFDKDGDEDMVQFDQTLNYATLFLNKEGSMEANVNLPVSGGRMQKLDYNGDGFPDILFLADNGYNVKSKLFKNEGPDGSGAIQFRVVKDDFPVGDVSVSSADYDHDGDIDIFFTGKFCVMYNNELDDDFKETMVPNFSAGRNNTQWVDFDSDGDLDLFMTGYFAVDDVNNVDHPYGYVLKNQLIVSGKGIGNQAPTAPSGLTSHQDTEGLHLSWTSQPDDHTPLDALSHDVIIYKDGKQIMKGLSDPVTGIRLRLQAGRSAGSLIVDNLAYGVYTWRVQAIDQAFLGSALSSLGQFTFIPQAPLMKDTVVYTCDREITLAAVGTNIEWYSDEALTVKLATGNYSPEATQTVYVTQTITGMRGVARPVHITIQERPPMPVASVDSYFYCENSAGSLAELAVSGQNITWYRDAEKKVSAGSGNQLEVVQSEQTYYATQTIGDCESEPMEVEVKPLVIDSDIHFEDGKIYTDEEDGDFYQWFKNNSALANSDSYSLNGVDEGDTYKVYIEKGACSETSTPTVITAIEEIETNGVRIFPNPASHSFTINLVKSIAGVLKIYDVAGKIVFEKMITYNGDKNLLIQSSAWRSGIYFVTISTGQKTLSTKIMIK